MYSGSSSCICSGAGLLFSRGHFPIAAHNLNDNLRFCYNPVTTFLLFLQFEQDFCVLRKISEEPAAEQV